MAEKISKGFYQLKKLSLVPTNNKPEFDFDSNIEMLRYEESIFDLGVAHGQVVFQDVADYCKKIPIIGGEKINFQYSFGPGTPEVKKTFVVYKVDVNTDSISLRSSVTLSFISAEMMESMKKTINRSYKDKTSKEIVQNLFDEVNQSTNSKIKISPDTSGTHQIIIPKMHPLEAINFIAARTQHSSYKSGLFFFFENSYGFNFYSVEELLNKDSLGVFQKNKQVQDTGVREKPNSILEMTPISTNPDILNSIKSGAFGSTMVTYDPVIASYKEVKYDYNKNFKDTSSLNEYKLIQKDSVLSNSNQKVIYFPSNSLRKNSGKFSGESAFSNNFEEIALYSNAVLAQLFSKHYAITIKGDDVSSLLEKKPRMLTIGETIEINFPTKSIDEKEINQPHTYVNGKYLVYWCEHIFNITKYVIKARIISDSNIADHANR